MRRRAELAAAYRATTYRVRLDGSVVDLRIDACHPLLDGWLAGRGAASWAWLSAANPGSRRLAAAENRRRHAELLARVEALGLDCVVGASLADAGDWPTEASVLIAGIDASVALGLARDFAQNALLLGERGGPARLVWVADAAA